MSISYAVFCLKKKKQESARHGSLIKETCCVRRPRGTSSCAESPHRSFRIFFFNDTATTEIYTLSLHDALPIRSPARAVANLEFHHSGEQVNEVARRVRSEEHTSELQSHVNLVCRLLLEKKKKKQINLIIYKKKKKNKPNQ